MMNMMIKRQLHHQKEDKVTSNHRHYQPTTLPLSHPSTTTRTFQYRTSHIPQTNIPETTVDIHNESHCNQLTGATHIHVVGMYATNEYP